MTDDTTNDIDDDGGAKSGLLADYMDDAEFAREMGVAPRTIKRWDRLEEGPPITRIGRKKYPAPSSRRCTPKEASPKCEAKFSPPNSDNRKARKWQNLRK